MPTQNICKKNRFTEIMCPDYIPDLSNPFLLEFLPEILDSKDLLMIENLKIIGFEKIKVTKTIFILSMFHEWLKILELSDAKISLNFGPKK